jgi:hypothetical protein
MPLCGTLLKINYICGGGRLHRVLYCYRYLCALAFRLVCVRKSGTVNHNEFLNVVEDYGGKNCHKQFQYC